ncbi:MAG: relaxase/mobilization nuclease domain-containing protein [Clostridium sp.]|nr:relaxase/mobilization nuclease domain-containing protein [Clostridium sp.]
MATTGFWPVKSSLKEVIDYAQNPDKTIDKRYVDNDLARVINYSENEQKTDKKMYVTGINCAAPSAYEAMMTTKKRFGKFGGNVAYHGYQSFVSGEVTPEEAHKIGIITAQKMWGNRYEVLVTTHLNTDNIHNHIVVNSLSFVDGKKFENKISDHKLLRQISDEICLNYGKSVIKNANFYSKNKNTYWFHQSGKMTHRDMLKHDIEESLQMATDRYSFVHHLKTMGYKLKRDNDCNLVVIAPGWQRPIRMKSIGYPANEIKRRLDENYYKNGFDSGYLFYKPKEKPLKLLLVGYNQLKNMNGIQLTFALISELLKLLTGNNISQDKAKPLSPMLRQEVRNAEKINKEYLLLTKNGIRSVEELSLFIEQKQGQINILSSQRQCIYNRCRRANNSDKELLYAKARKLTKKMKPLRDEMKIAKSVLERVSHLDELLKTEMTMENIRITQRAKINQER